MRDKKYKRNISTNRNLKVSKEHQYLIFRKVVLFKIFSPDQVKELLDAGEVKLFSDKQIILMEGSNSFTFYLVSKGKVCVSKGKILIHELGVGECFGEIS